MDSEWIYEPSQGAYFHPKSQMYAVCKAGTWQYVPITDFRSGESSTLPEEKEEGELEDDVGWGGLMEPDEVERVQKSDYKKYTYRITPPPPTPRHILRLVVNTSSTLPPGGMAMIDAREGGVHLGRDRQEGQARLRIKEMEVSKTHAVIYWGQGCERAEEEGKGDEEEGWWIVDLGSTHGTYIAGNRLSEPKASSLPHRLQHMSTITIGQTTLTAHIHPSWPCDACQLKGETEIKLDEGSASAVVEPQLFDVQGSREMREAKRKREMASLKEVLLEGSTPVRSGDYQDRAAMRRRLHPPSPPSSSSSTTTAVSTAAPSFAAKILANQGWSPGEGLGKSGEGRAEPVTVQMRNEKWGLGAAGSKLGTGDWRVQGKERRYDEIGR